MPASVRTCAKGVLAMRMCLLLVPDSFVCPLHPVDYQVLTHISAEETRIRWVQTQTRADNLFLKIKELVNSGIYAAEDVLHHLMALLSGGWEETKEKSGEAYGAGKAKTSEVYEEGKAKAGEAQGWAGKKKGEAEGWAEEKVDNARKATGEKVKVGGQKIKGEL